MAVSPEEFDQRQRAINEQLLERATSDPSFKRKLIDDPDAAVREAGLEDEAQQLQEALPKREAGMEVDPHGFTWYRLCLLWSYIRYCL
ncbi:MAG: hypothetical protein ICV64_03415 [Thermoleophilia bacterium]|nr:hypothetical protein [Thermoleophilia bacterium]